MNKSDMILSVLILILVVLFVMWLTMIIAIF